MGNIGVDVQGQLSSDAGEVGYRAFGGGVALGDAFSEKPLPEAPCSEASKRAMWHG